MVIHVPRQSCYQAETSRISKPTRTTREERRETYKKNTARKNFWGEYWNSLRKRQDRIKSRIRARIIEITKKLLIFGTKLCRRPPPLFSSKNLLSKLPAYFEGISKAISKALLVSITTPTRQIMIEHIGSLNEVRLALNSSSNPKWVSMKLRAAIWGF